MNFDWLNDQDAVKKIEKGLTAYVALDDAFVSIASRIFLIRNAKRTLDLQYYIWNKDFIGQLMLNELYKAANRGIKIRLLIDDQNGNGLDPILRALSDNPAFEIRLFNPYKFRKLRVLDYLFRAKAINHRMHNKLIIADDCIAVIGGRNISGEYFEAGNEFQFFDLDILFYGTAVTHAVDVFQNFWNFSLSLPIRHFVGATKSHDQSKLKQLFKQFNEIDTPVEKKIYEAQSELDNILKNYSLRWKKAYFVADVPQKILGESRQDELIYHQIAQLMGYPSNHLELVSAYFVPTRSGTAFLSKQSRQGIKIRILTNSFIANDVAIVHAFYSKYRQALLESGVKLYELKSIIPRKKPTWYEKLTGRVIPAKGKSNSSLHAKFFDIEGKVFIGSFNFDPRSAHINTEVGLVVESEELQQNITDDLDKFLPLTCYELSLDEQGNVIWTEYLENGETIKYAHDPKTTKFQRLVMKFMACLPIEWMM